MTIVLFSFCGLGVYTASEKKNSITSTVLIAHVPEPKTLKLKLTRTLHLNPAYPALKKPGQLRGGRKNAPDRQGAHSGRKQEGILPASCLGVFLVPGAAPALRPGKNNRQGKRKSRCTRCV